MDSDFRIKSDIFSNRIRDTYKTDEKSSKKDKKKQEENLDKDSKDSKKTEKQNNDDKGNNLDLYI